MDTSKYRNIRTKFWDLFANTPLMVRSPGRINLIGEHTDYNDGFVLPAAIDKELLLAFAPNHTESCNLFAWDLQEHFSFQLDHLEKSTSNWANYIIGVVQQLLKRQYPVKGFDCVFGGDIPLGAGMSSSAALECGVAYGLSKLWAFDIPKLEIAKLAQSAEREFVGVQCGLMDQYANMFGKKEHLIRLDCRDLTHEEVKADFSDHCLLLFNSNVKHELGNTEYNTRRLECEEGVRMVKQHFPEVQSLRDCQSSMLSAIDSMHEKIHDRCEYVIEENDRVLGGMEDLIMGRLEAFGKKMYLSHQGLSEKYQVSCPELDILVSLTSDEDTVLGARMMGGGFGGCTINLVIDVEVDDLIKRVAAQYHKATGKAMLDYRVETAQGTSFIKDLNITSKT